MLRSWFFIITIALFQVFYTVGFCAMAFEIWHLSLGWMITFVVLAAEFWYSPIGDVVRQRKTLSAEQLATEMGSYSLFTFILIISVCLVLVWAWMLVWAFSLYGSI